MQKIVSSGYSIFYGNESLNSLSRKISAAKYSSIFILVDENTNKHCLPQLIINCNSLANAEIIEIESGETNKNIDICIGSSFSFNMEGEISISNKFWNISTGISTNNSFTLGVESPFSSGNKKSGYNFIIEPKWENIFEAAMYTAIVGATISLVPAPVW